LEREPTPAALMADEEAAEKAAKPAKFILKL
jgi:hypothetical protein